MSSTGTQILNLLESHISVGTTTSNTNPTQALLVQYLNIAQRKMAFLLQPSELRNVSGTSISVTSGELSVALPATIMIIENVFYKQTSSWYKELVKKKLPNVIDPNYFFDSTNNIHPSFFEIRGNYISVDAPFGTTSAAGLKVFGLSAPTDIDTSSLATSIDTSKEYDMLLVYMSSALFYQRDDDSKNYNIQKQAELREIAELRSMIVNDFPSSITLSTRFWGYGDR